jgi:subtilisin family serine protease
VLNYSLGSTSPNTVTRDAMAYAISKGVFIAMSNGNEFNNGNPTTYPASYGPGLNGAMAVAAIVKSQGKASYSSTGSWTEISAPGGGSGDSVYQATLIPSDSDQLAGVRFPRFDRYAMVGYTGTSMASPHVAGLAALIISRNPSITPAQVEQVIKVSARELGTTGRDDTFGFGLIQPRAALFGQGVR